MGMIYELVDKGFPVAEYIRMADERMYVQKAEHRMHKDYIGR